MAAARLRTELLECRLAVVRQIRGDVEVVLPLRSTAFYLPADLSRALAFLVGGRRA